MGELAGGAPRHPLALDTSTVRYGGDRERPHDGFVVGVKLEEYTKEYPYEVAAQERVINDSVGPHPVMMYADPETRNVHVYLRGTRGRQVLTFALRDGLLVDEQTDTLWDTATGQPLLRSLAEQPLPTLVGVLGHGCHQCAGHPRWRKV